MKKESTKEALAKKKKNIKITCYVSLVVLVILLFLPPLLRAFTTSETKKTEKKEVIVLSCDKADESISSTFLGEEPQNILYRVKGNYTMVNVNNPDEINNYYPDENDGTSSETPSLDSDQSNIVDATPGETNETIQTSETEEQKTQENSPVDISNKPVFTLLRTHSNIAYDEATDITSLSVYVSDIKGINEYQTIFKAINDQEAYFKSQGFSCSKTIV